MLTLTLITNVRVCQTMFIIFRIYLKYVDLNSDYCTLMLSFIQISHI